MKRLLELADEIDELHHEIVRLQQVEREYIELKRQFDEMLRSNLAFQHRNAGNLLKLGLAADPDKLAELFKDES